MGGMMEQTEHTPGPWFFDVHPDNTQAVLIDADGCTVMYLSKPFPNTLNKEVRLIAAAPDLLGELVKITDAYAEAMKDAGVTHYPEALVVVRQARAAIAKARGG